MSETIGGNGNGKMYVDCGDTELTLDHAAAVFRLLWDRHRAMLSALIGEAYTGTKPSGTRTKA